MKKISFALGVCFALYGALAGANDWVFDTSRRAAEVTSSRSGSMTMGFDSRSVGCEFSVSGAVDSRWGEVEASSPMPLDTTNLAFYIVIR